MGEVQRLAIPFAVRALVLLASACALAGCLGLSQGDPEAPPAEPLGLIIEEPRAWSSRMAVDPWLRDLRVGTSTFGRSVNWQFRFGIDGSGPEAGRDVALETPATVRLLNTPGRQRAKQLVQGGLQVLQDRDGVVNSISWAANFSQFQAAAISGFADDFGRGAIPRGERSTVSRMLNVMALDLAGNNFAWFNFDRSAIVVGPTLTRTFVKHVSTPGRVTQAEGIFAAYVFRHEIEHAVTANGERPNPRMRWLEEGGADVLARWSGAAAETARAMGLPYPKRYERIGYATNRAGYPEWAATMRILLAGAGANSRRPGDFRSADELLQEPMLQDVPLALATALLKRHGRPASGAATLSRRIIALQGRPAQARRLVRALERR